MFSKESSKLLIFGVIVAICLSSKTEAVTNSSSSTGRGSKSEEPTIKQCLNDFGWYLLRLSNLLRDIGDDEVVITIGSFPMVEMTVGEIFDLVSTGNLGEEIVIRFSYYGDYFLEISAAEILALSRGEETIENILSDVHLDQPIVGEEILKIYISLYIGNDQVGAISLGELFADGDSEAAIDFITSLINEETSISIVEGNLAINNVTLPEILGFLGLNATSQIIDFGDLEPMLDFGAVNITMPPPWVIQMIDASGFKSLPSNVARGNTWSVGNFQQCLNVDAQEIDGIIFDDPSSGEEISLEATSFRGQYCSATISNVGATSNESRILLLPGSLPVLGASTSGMCVPDSCTTDMLNSPRVLESLMRAGLPFSVDNFFACTTNETKTLSTLEIFAIIVLFLLATALLAGTVADLLESSRNRRKYKRADDTNSTFTEMVLAFSIVKNARTILSTGPRKTRDKNADAIDCLHGIRFISMTWVILAHTFSMPQVYQLSDPSAYYAEWEKFSHQPLVNGLPSVDSFFFISGLLVTYTVLKHLNKNGFSWGFIPKLYLHRYLRLTPLYAMITFVLIAFYDRVGSGPFWPFAHDMEFRECPEKWWHNFFYITTLMSPSQECIGVGWYLSNDFLFFLASPFLILPVYLAGDWGAIYMVLVFLSSFGITYGVHMAYDAPGALSLSNLLDAEAFAAYGRHVYFRPHTRFGVYVVGLFAGYVLYKVRKKDIKLSSMTVFLGWCSSAAVGMAVVYGLYEGNGPIDKDVLLAYGVFHRQAWGLALFWVVFACFTGHGGWINTFLSWNAFKPLGRLAYASFLIHIFVLDWNLFAAKTQKRFDPALQIYNFIGHLIITNALSFCAAVAVELPIGTVSSILLEKRPKRAAERKMKEKEDYYTWKRKSGYPTIIVSYEDSKNFENHFEKRLF